MKKSLSKESLEVLISSALAHFYCGCAQYAMCTIVFLIFTKKIITF